MLNPHQISLPGNEYREQGQPWRAGDVIQLSLELTKDGWSLTAVLERTGQETK